MIYAKYDEEHGDWIGIHDESPYMVVSGDTEEIALGIIKRALVWYQEKQVRIREKEVLAELSKVVQITDTTDDPLEDTAPSEISGC